MALARILIADDNARVRSGVRKLLETQPDWEVVGEAVNGRETVARVEELGPDVVLLDISMPEMDGLQAAPLIRKAAPRTELLVFSQNAVPDTIRRAFAGGVRGYVLKSDATRDLLKGIRAVLCHNRFLSAGISLPPGDGLETKPQGTAPSEAESE